MAVAMPLPPPLKNAIAWDARRIALFPNFSIVESNDFPRGEGSPMVGRWRLAARSQGRGETLPFFALGPPRPTQCRRQGDNVRGQRSGRWRPDRGWYRDLESHTVCAQVRSCAPCGSGSGYPLNLYRGLHQSRKAPHLAASRIVRRSVVAPSGFRPVKRLTLGDRHPHSHCQRRPAHLRWLPGMLRAGLTRT